VFSKIKDYVIAGLGVLAGVLFLGMKYIRFKNQILENDLKNAKTDLEIKDFESKRLEQGAYIDNETEAYKKQVDDFNKRQKELKNEKNNNDDAFDSIYV